LYLKINTKQVYDNSIYDSIFRNNLGHNLGNIYMDIIIYLLQCKTNTHIFFYMYFYTHTHNILLHWLQA